MDILVNGILLGLAYCLIAVGMALILGVAKVFDLIYASYYTIAAYMVVILMAVWGANAPLWVLFAIGMTVAIGVALGAHNYLILPIRKQPNAVLVSTMAVAMIIQELLIFIEGSEPKHLPALVTGASNVLGVWVTKQKLLAGGVTVAMIGFLWLFFTRTRLGLAIRATAEQPEAMELAGGNIRKVCLSAAILSAVVAGVGGLLLAPIIPPHPHAWLDLLIIAFAVMVLGGMGNLWGCIPAGLILGVSEVAFAIYVPYGGIIKRTIGLMIIFFILVFRPTGLFGVQGWEEEA